MISSDVIRGYNDTFILFLLLDQPSYGYEISKQIRRLTDEVNQLYEDILNALPKDNQHLIHDMMNSQMFLTTDNVACAFAEGFRLGVKMSAEVWGK